MKDLSTYFSNIFPKGDKIPDLKLNTFVEDHVVKIEHYNTSGQYTTMLNVTKTAAKDFSDSISDKDIKAALSKSHTRAVDICVRTFKKRLPHLERVIGIAFDPDEDIYPEFFPHGLKEYYRASKSNIDQLMLRLCEAADDHTSDFETAFIDGLHQTYDQFNQARGEQLTAKINLKAATLVKRTARRRIELQVTRNVLALAIEFLEKPEHGLAFFDTSLLKLHQHKKKKDETVPLV